MGLAASQARYLALTARKSDLEYKSQTINSRRIQLAYKTAEIAREYSEGMNNSRIKISMNKLNTNTGEAEQMWKELTFKNMYDEGYMVIGSQGTALHPSPYNRDQVTVHKRADAKGATIPDEFKVIDAKAYSDLGDSALRNLYSASVVTTDGKEEKKYVLKPTLTQEEYNALVTYEQGINSTTYTSLFQDVEDIDMSWKVNPMYINEGGADIQSLLVSGQAQIVPKAFFQYVTENDYYNYENGLQGAYTWAQLLEKWQNDTIENPSALPAIIDWRADESEKFQQRTYTEDDEKVLAKYEAETAKVQAQDKMLEIEEKNIETQHKAIETELDNIKKVIQKNIDETFKIFS